MSALLPVIVIAAIAVCVIVVFARSENAKNERWVAAMQTMSSRCLDCGGMGFHFGPPGTGDPDVSTPTCRTCGGTGRVGDA